MLYRLAQAENRNVAIATETAGVHLGQPKLRMTLLTDLLNYCILPCADG